MCRPVGDYPTETHRTLQHISSLDSNGLPIIALPHMKLSAGMTMRIAFWGLALGLLAIVMTGVPITASAAEMTSTTQQILPPGVASTCPQLSASDFTPYIYDNALNSFEFTVPNASYVAIAGSVGGNFIPFHFMTRRVSPSGTLRIHVDIATTPIDGTLPIEITLLSSPGPGQPTCISVVSMNVGSGPIQNAPTTNTAGVTPITTPSAPTTGGSSQNSQGGEGSTTSAGGNASSSIGGMASSILRTPFDTLCASNNGAFRLWLILLGLYALLAVALVYQEWPSAWSVPRAPEWRLAGLLLPLLLLLALWYFSPVCRSSWWMPLVAAIIAAIAALIVFRDHPRMTTLLLPESSKKK